MHLNAIAPCEKFTSCRRPRVMVCYPETREVIQDGSQPPKLGSYTPPLPYLVVKRHIGDTN